MFRTLLSLAFALCIMSSASISALAQEKKDTFPVPEPKPDEATEYQNSRIVLLRAAYLEMRLLLCQKDNSPAWKQRYHNGLKAIIVAQHQVVWALSGQLDDEEERRRLNFTNPTAIVNKLLRDAVRTKTAGEKQAVNAAIIRLERKWKDLDELSRAKVDNQSFIAMYSARAFFAAFEKEFPVAKRNALGISAAYAGARNEAMNWADNVRGRVYSRTVAKINTMLPVGAMPFVLYKFIDPDDPTGSVARQENVKRELLRQAAALLPTSPSTMPAEFIAVEDTSNPRQLSEVDFGDSAQETIMGGCGRTVLMRYDPSREPDSVTARDLLEKQNYVVRRERTTALVPADIGKIFQRRSGEIPTRQARAIARLMSPFEALEAKERISSDVTKPEYEFSLSNKSCGNRMGYDPVIGGGFNLMRPVRDVPETPLMTINASGYSFDRSEMFELVVEVQPSTIPQSGTYHLKRDDGSLIASQNVDSTKATYTYCVPYTKGKKFHFSGNAASSATEYPRITIRVSVYPIVKR